MLRIQTICLVILTIIAGGFALHYLQSVLLPFVIAFFIVSGCRPILDYLEGRFHLHWILSFAVTFGIGVILLAGFSFLTWLSIHDLSSNFSKFEDRITFITDWVFERFPDESPFQPTSNEGDSASNNELTNPQTSSANEGENSEDGLANNDFKGSSEPPENSSNENGAVQNSLDAEVGDPVSKAGKLIAAGAFRNVDQVGVTISQMQEAKEKLRQRNATLTQNPVFPSFGSSPSTPVDRSILKQPSAAMKRMFESLGEYAQGFILNFAGTLTSLLSSAILILIYVFFLLLGRSEETRDRVQIVKAIDDQIRKYIVMKTVISAATGLATWFVLWRFGVPLAVVFGLLTFLINFIPNIGPVIISLLPLPFLILNPDMNVFTGILVFVLVASIQFLSGNVIETRLMGKSFDVNPVVLLLALMFFGLIWGIPGMFLATPIVSVLKIVLQQRESTKPFANMLAGRWDGAGFNSQV